MPKFNDLAGRKFNRLVAISRAKNRGHHTYWTCRCDCGNIVDVEASLLLSGRIKSCGCYKLENDKRLREERTIHGMSDTRLFHIWEDMIRRCESKNRKSYQHYGGRGIKVCEEWHSFIPFMEWSMQNGYEENLSIDRIENDGNYCPENCRWVTHKEQCNNTRRNQWVYIFGEKMNYAQAAEKFGINQSTIRGRIVRGWKPEVAVMTPPKSCICVEEANDND